MGPSNSENVDTTSFHEGSRHCTTKAWPSLRKTASAFRSTWQSTLPDSFSRSVCFKKPHLWNSIDVGVSFLGVPVACPLRLLPTPSTLFFAGHHADPLLKKAVFTTEKKRFSKKCPDTSGYLEWGVAKMAQNKDEPPVYFLGGLPERLRWYWTSRLPRSKPLRSHAKTDAFSRNYLVAVAEEYFFMFPVGLKRKPSLLDICCHFSGRLKQMEVGTAEETPLLLFPCSDSQRSSGPPARVSARR